ncbi:hypothetical protein H6F77_07525 [Microcoleus sp. FACHB-831]|jgi:hypothetical protein|nr:hypothetical protein [Microcoleus sp. FACHB-831]MBD1920936.1 hypothetical protein [Microcoleus sp. FACHB-831]
MTYLPPQQPEISAANGFGMAIAQMFYLLSHASQTLLYKFNLGQLFAAV